MREQQLEFSSIRHAHHATKCLVYKITQQLETGNRPDKGSKGKNKTPAANDTPKGPSTSNPTSCKYSATKTKRPDIVVASPSKRRPVNPPDCNPTPQKHPLPLCKMAGDKAYGQVEDGQKCPVERCKSLVEGQA